MILLPLLVIFFGKLSVISTMRDYSSGGARMTYKPIVPATIYRGNQTIRFRTAFYEERNKTFDSQIGWRMVWQKHIDANNYSSSSLIVLVRPDGTHLTNGVLLNSSTILIRGRHNEQSKIYSLRYNWTFNGPRKIQSFEYIIAGNYTLIRLEAKVPRPATSATIFQGINYQPNICQIFSFSDSFDLQRLRLFVKNDSFCFGLFPPVDLSQNFCGELEVLNKKNPEAGLRFKTGERYRIKGKVIPLKVHENYPVFCRQDEEYKFAGFAFGEKMWGQNPFMLVKRMHV